MVKRRRDIEGVKRALDHHTTTGVLRSVRFDENEPKPFLVGGEAGHILAERMSVDDAYWLAIGIRLAELRYAPHARVAELVHEQLDSSEWGADTLNEIGVIYANADWKIAEHERYEGVDS